MENKNHLQEEINGVENTTNQFEIFNYENLGTIRAFIDEQRNKWFCHKDVYNILEQIDRNVESVQLTPDGVCSIPIIDKFGEAQEIKFINEDNLTRLITSLCNPRAKKFTDWMFDVVFPTLKASKSYHVMDNEPKEEDVIEELQKQIANQEDKINLLEDKIKKIISRRIEELENIINTSYMNINDYSKHRKLDVNSAMEKYLGEMASETSEEWNAPVFSEQHEKRGNVNIYRVDVLKYVFDRFYKYADIIYGDED